MHNASQPESNLTATLIFARALVRDLNVASLTEEQIGLLHEIANFACTNAQEARYVHNERDLAAIEQLEEQDETWESDAMDHSIGGEDRHLDGYWESLTDVGDMGGGDW
jgi:hypothetical protein